MAERTPTAAPKPTIGRIVIYRSQAGVDMPAIITAVDALHALDAGGRDATAVHLQLFVPPGEARDVLSHEWGVPEAAGEPRRGTWRWSEIVA